MRVSPRTSVIQPGRCPSSSNNSAAILMPTQAPGISRAKAISCACVASGCVSCSVGGRIPQLYSGKVQFVTLFSAFVLVARNLEAHHAELSNANCQVLDSPPSQRGIGLAFVRAGR